MKARFLTECPAGKIKGVEGLRSVLISPSMFRRKTRVCKLILGGVMHASSSAILVVFLLKET